MRRCAGTMVVIAAGILALAVLSSCATVKVNPLPEPPPTAKLRIYVEAFTLGPASRKWHVPHETYAQNQVKRTGKFLERTGIYEVVPASDVLAALGGQALQYDSLRSGNWTQARAIGKALHADYVFVIARDQSNIGTGEWTIFFTTELVNVESGRTFKSQYSVSNVTPADHEYQLKLVRDAYRDLFRQAKRDMFALAVRKGRAYAPPPLTKQPEPRPPMTAQKPAEPPVPEEPAKAAAVQEAPAARNEAASAVAKVVPPSPNLTGAGLIEEPKRDRGAKKLVVYDLESTDQYRIVALIFAEALREEVFKLKEYILVNREDLQKVLEEMALQQTGLIDEQQAVRTGKGLAANQVVTGRLGQLGKTFMVQAKRVDVETIATLGIASLKYTEGQEEEALNRLPDFARSLAGL